MASQNVETAKASIEAFNKRDYSSYDKIFAPELTFKDHALSGIDNPAMPNDGWDLDTKDQVEQWWGAWEKGFPDGKVEIEGVYEDGNTVIITGVGKGTNTGEFGPFTGKGQKIELPFASVHRFNGQGQIEESHFYSDVLTVLVQAGHMPEPKDMV